MKNRRRTVITLIVALVVALTLMASLSLAARADQQSPAVVAGCGQQGTPGR